MVAILVVVFIIGMIGITWYVANARNVTEQVVDEDLRLSVSRTARTVADLPELKYSVVGREDSTTIDWYRALAFSSTVDVEGRDLFRERFSGYRATLRCVTPCDERFGELTLFNYTGSAREILPFTIPVSLYDPVTRASSFGTLTVERVIG